MNPEELAVWVSQNRKALRRADHWTCHDHKKSDPYAVLYINRANSSILWVAGVQRTHRQGNQVKTKARAFNLSELVASGQPLTEAAQSRQRVELIFAASLAAVIGFAVGIPDVHPVMATGQA